MSDPRGSRKYRRNNLRLRSSLPPYCTACGEWVDYSLPTTDAMSWTTDHTTALADGGALYGERTLYHRRCNSQKERARIEGSERPLSTTRDW